MKATTISWFILIFLIKSKIKLRLLQAYSLEVERTAHNGFVVGSSPTKPNK